MYIYGSKFDLLKRFAVLVITTCFVLLDRINKIKSNFCVNVNVFFFSFDSFYDTLEVGTASLPFGAADDLNNKHLLYIYI